jgi:hypothetical protein
VTLRRLAGILFADPGPYVNAWNALASNNSDHLKKLIHNLSRLPGNPSPLAERLKEDLKLQLEMRRAGLETISVAKMGSKETLSFSLDSFVRLVLEWQERTGYFGSLRPDRGRVVRYPVCGPVYWRLRNSLINVDREFIESWRRNAGSRLTGKFNSEVLNWVLDEIDGTGIPERNHMW